MENNKVSIIIPVYKVEKYIKECVDSALNQSYKNIEIILVDDGSPDNCPKICDDYQNNDSRIKVIHKKNGGLSDARNAGIRIASGDYVFFLDSDDLILENTIEKLMELANLNNSQVVVCPKERFKEHYNSNNYKEKIKVYSAQEYFISILKFKSDTIASGCLVNKSLLTNFEFKKDRYYEDLASMYYIYSKANNIITTNICYYKYRDNPNSIVNTINTKKINDYIMSAEEMTNYIKNNYLIDKSLIDTYMYCVYLSSYIMSNDIKNLNIGKSKYLHNLDLNNLENKMKIRILISIFAPRIINVINFIKNRR